MSRTNFSFISPGFEELVLSVQRRAEMLEKTQFSKGLDWSEIQTLASFLDAYKAYTGSIICKQGDNSEFMCVVCRGRVDIIKEDLDHHEKVIASLGPGNSLGEMALIDGERRSATAVAHSPLELLVLAKNEYERLSEEYPRLWGKLVVKVAVILSCRLRRTSGVLAEYLES